MSTRIQSPWRGPAGRRGLRTREDETWASSLPHTPSSLASGTSVLPRASPTCAISPEDTDGQVRWGVCNRNQWLAPAAQWDGGEQGGGVWVFSPVCLSSVSPQPGLHGEPPSKQPPGPACPLPTPTAPRGPPALPAPPMAPRGPGPCLELTGHIEQDGSLGTHVGTGEGHPTGEVGAVVLRPRSEGEHRGVESLGV